MTELDRMHERYAQWALAEKLKQRHETPTEKHRRHWREAQRMMEPIPRQPQEEIDQANAGNIGDIQYEEEMIEREENH